MQIENNSNWLSSTIELLTCTGELQQTIRIEGIGYIDYIITDEGKDILIRALVDENYNATPAYVNTVREIIVELEENYNEAVILSNRITESAYNVVKQHENLEIFTPKMEQSFNLIKLVSAIKIKTRELCTLKCGKLSVTKEDCIGKEGSKKKCDIYRLGDDAAFHVKMNWNNTLLEDFYNLCNLKRRMLEEN
jgi:hypothetical protein